LSAARAIAEATLNTEVLRKLSGLPFTPENVERALNETGRPDQRLYTMLAATDRKDMLPDNFADDLVSKLAVLFEGTPLAQLGVAAAVESLYKRISPETLDILNRLDDLETDALHVFLSSMFPELNIVHPAVTAPEITRFHNEVAEQLEKEGAEVGLEIPRAKVANTHDSALEAANAKFRPKQMDQLLVREEAAQRSSMYC
jgi:hypothetical protein